jgi:peptidoglycan hydrolase CwlO-like protein
LFRKLERGAQVFGLTVTIILMLATGASPEKGHGASVDAYASRIKEKSSALDSIKTELQRGRARIAELQQEEGNYLAQLEQVEENIETSESYLNELSSKIDTVSRRIEILKHGRDSAQSALSSRQLKMRKRLRTMYMTGSPDLGQIILSSADVTDMLNRGKYFLELKHYDQELMRHIDSTKSVLTRATVELEETKLQYMGLKQDKQTEQQQLVEQKSSRTTTLSKIQQEKAANIAMVKELEQAQRDLNELLASLEKQRKQVKRNKVVTASKEPVTSRCRGRSSRNSAASCTPCTRP